MGKRELSQSKRMMRLLGFFAVAFFVCVVMSNSVQAKATDMLPTDPTVPFQPVVLGEGTWYITGEAYGGYLVTGDAEPTMEKDLLRRLGDAALWRVLVAEEGIYLVSEGDGGGLLSVSAGGNPILVSGNADDVAKGTQPEGTCWSVLERITKNGRGYSVLYNEQKNAVLFAFENGTLGCLSKEGYEKTCEENGSYEPALFWFGSSKEYGEDAAKKDLNSFSLDNVDLKSLNKSLTLNIHAASDARFTEAFDFFYEFEDPTIATVDSDGVITPQKTGSTRIYLTHKYSGAKSQCVLRITSNAIIIVPGLFGSNLADAKSGELLWSEDVLEELTGLGTFYSSLKKLEKVFENIDNASVVAVRNDYGMGNAYRKLVQYIEQQNPGDYTVEFFGYDWRQSTAVTGRELSDYVRDRGYDSVIFVSHSLGGLVVSQYLACSEANIKKTEKVISLGSPYAGSTEVLYLWGPNVCEFTVTMGAGTMPDMVANMIQDTLLEYIANLPSVYELLPNEYAFSNLDEWEPIVGVTTYEQAVSIYKAYLENFSTKRMSVAQEANAKVYTDGQHILDRIDEVYFVYGYAKSTVNAVKTDGQRFSYIYTDTGDSIVPYMSATMFNHRPDHVFHWYYNHQGLAGYDGLSQEYWDQLKTWIFGEN